MQRQSKQTDVVREEDESLHNKTTIESLTIRMRLQQSASEQMKQEQDGNIARATIEYGQSIFSAAVAAITSAMDQPAPAMPMMKAKPMMMMMMAMRMMAVAVCPTFESNDGNDDDELDSDSGDNNSNDSNDGDDDGDDNDFDDGDDGDY